MQGWFSRKQRSQIANSEARWEKVVYSKRITKRGGEQGGAQEAANAFMPRGNCYILEEENSTATVTYGKTLISVAKSNIA